MSYAARNIRRNTTKPESIPPELGPVRYCIAGFSSDANLDAQIIAAIDYIKLVTGAP